MEVSVAEGSRQDAEYEEEVSLDRSVSNWSPDRETYNAKPGKQHAKELVEELNQEENIPQQGVLASEDLVEVGKGVDGGEERSV